MEVGGCSIAEAVVDEGTPGRAGSDWSWSNRMHCECTCIAHECTCVYVQACVCVYACAFLSSYM